MKVESEPHAARPRPGHRRTWLIERLGHQPGPVPSELGIEISRTTADRGIHDQLRGILVELGEARGRRAGYGDGLIDRTIRARREHPTIVGRPRRQAAQDRRERGFSKKVTVDPIQIGIAGRDRVRFTRIVNTTEGASDAGGQ